MFVLRVHLVDDNDLITTEETGFATTASRSNPNPNPKFRELRGLVYLFRGTYRPSPTFRSTTLFVVAVPSYFSADDFILSCGSHISHVDDIVFIRNDVMEDRYSVLIKFVDQLSADGFYGDLNGKLFSPGEAEVCHILFMLSVEYTELAAIASTAPEGFTELPTCPMCLERLDPDTSGILSTIRDQSFQCSCTSKWTSFSCQVCRFCQQQDKNPTCSVCWTMKELYVCLICGYVGCGRYEEGHALRHWKDTQHCYSLDLRTQQIWDYVGDKYVHRLNQSNSDGKSVGMNSRCMSHGEHRGTCDCSEDSGISGALFNSKVEALGSINSVSEPFRFKSMVNTRVENRIEELEQSVKSLSEKMGTLTEKVGKGETTMEEFMKEIRQFMGGNTKGQVTETLQPSTVVTHQPFIPLQPRPENDSGEQSRTSQIPPNVTQGNGFQRPQSRIPHQHPDVNFGDEEDGFLQDDDWLNVDQNQQQRQAIQVDRGRFGNQQEPGWPSDFPFRQRNHFLRLEVPTFSGDDPVGWIAKVERYFLVNGIISEEDKILSILICLEGAALGWYEYQQMRRPFISWWEFKAAVVKRFGPGQLYSPEEELIRLRQTGSVAEFRQRFEWLAATVVEASEGWLMAAFLAGLREEIQAEIRLLGPRSLDQTMKLAQGVETRNVTLGRSNRVVGADQQKTYISSGRRPSTFASSSYPQRTPAADVADEATGTRPTTTGVVTTGRVALSSYQQRTPAADVADKATGTRPTTTGVVTTGRVSSQGRNGGFKRLSPAEYQSKREKGLCFKCDEKYGPNHRCRFKQLRLLLCRNHSDGGEDSEDVDEDELTDCEEVENRTIELSRQSVCGFDSPGTMKIRAKVSGQDVVALIAGGATRSFICQKLVEKVGLQMGEKSFEVTLGNGKSVRGSGICYGVELSLPDIKITHDFLPFPLGSVEVILGVDWLSTLGETCSNWKTQVMHFMWEGKTVTLKGDPPLVQLETTF